MMSWQAVSCARRCVQCATASGDGALPLSPAPVPQSSLQQASSADSGVAQMAAWLQQYPPFNLLKVDAVEAVAQVGGLGDWRTLCLGVC